MEGCVLDDELRGRWPVTSEGMGDQETGEAEPAGAQPGQ